MQAKPKITIVTVVFNAKSLIEKTIQSVLSQTYPFIEYIIIDGASTDGTIDILNKYRSRITTVVSEKDSGIYDAMNKGLKRATGDYVLFLNAGDELFGTDTLSLIFNTSEGADVYYGNTKIIDKDGVELGNRRLTPPANLNWKSLRFGMCVSHQSFIPKRIICEPYNLDYKISSDIDWMISILKKSHIVIHVNLNISKFLEGGLSVKNRNKALKERFKIMEAHYGFVATLFNHVYILIRYFFHKITRKTMS